MFILLYIVGLFGAFYLGTLWRDLAIPYLVNRHLWPLAVALPGAVGAGLLLILR